MSIITITRGSYSRGEEVAKKVADRLGYRCISRETLLKASNEFSIPKIKRFLSFEKGPSEFELTTSQKEKFLAYVQLILLRDFQKDDVVHHGVGGHFIVRGIEHGLKVLVIENIEDTAGVVMEREGLSRKDALILLKRSDEPIIEWGRHIWGIHPWDSKLYDLIIHTKKISVDFAVDTICRTVELESFHTTPESQKAVNDRLLSAEAKWALIDLNPYAEVFSDDGSVTVMTVLETASSKSQEERDKLVDQIGKIVKKLPGVKEVTIDATLYPIGEA
ncbi:MAG: cytidylate kinase-like family protein [Desulfobacteraceae bacterium]|nr:cytidylate kinase-like family protein [Desulfobacteraceae bacterium]